MYKPKRLSESISIKLPKDIVVTLDKIANDRLTSRSLIVRESLLNALHNGSRDLARGAFPQPERKAEAA